MPKLDFNGVDEVDDFSPLPDGSYLCRLAEVEEDSTRNGDEMWKLRFAVEDGPHAGRYVFDNKPFTAAAMKRVKLICSRLGLDTGGEIDLTPELILTAPEEDAVGASWSARMADSSYDHPLLAY